MLDRILDREEKFERRVRRAAIVAWSVTFATLPLQGALFYFVTTGGGRMVDVARSAFAVVGMIGVFSLVLAVLMTVGWLFRSRAPTLTAIERRLAALENLLLARER